MNIIQFKDGATAKLFFDDGLAYNAAYEALKYKFPGAEFTPRFKNGTWDGYISLFNRKNSTFPTGLAFLVAQAIQKKDLQIAYQDARDKSRLIPTTINDDEIAGCLGTVTLRDYQVKAVKSILHHSNGIIHAATGSGKTLIAAGFIRLALNAGLKVLFLTNSTDLFYQTQSVLTSNDIPATIIGDSKKEFSQCCVGMLQTLFMGLPVNRPGKVTWVKGKRIVQPPVVRKGNPEIIDYLNSVDVVVFDECHIGSSESAQSVADRCSNTLYRVGLTATPLMKTRMDDLKLMAITGDIICRITMKDLIDRGLLAQPYIKFVRVKSPALHPKMPYSKAYAAGIASNESRNDMIVQEAASMASKGHTVLILVVQIQHGKTLFRKFEKFPGLRTKFISGQKDKETREAAIEMLKNKELDILISSTITDQGVDIPAVSMVILAGGGRSTIRLYQRIGRGMRPKEDDNSVYIVDFIDLTQRHLARHSLERYKTIKAEPGFIIVEDFDSIPSKS